MRKYFKKLSAAALTGVLLLTNMATVSAAELRNYVDVGDYAATVHMYFDYMDGYAEADSSWEMEMEISGTAENPYTYQDMYAYGDMTHGIKANVHVEYGIDEMHVNYWFGTDTGDVVEIPYDLYE